MNAAKSSTNISPFLYRLFKRSISPKQFFCTKYSKYSRPMSNQISLKWYKPSERLPEDGQVVIIREYFRSAKSGRYVIHVREFMYFEQYGFELEERCNRHLKYRITHWMPIPPI